MPGALDKSTQWEMHWNPGKKKKRKFIRSSYKEKNLLEFPWKSSIMFNYIEDAALSK